MHTHYDNLKIHRNADEQTIRQAYRRLSKQYHPDLNPSPDAHRIMQLVNQAYEVLSDPVRRAEHDRWIEAQMRIAQVPPITPMPPVSNVSTLVDNKNKSWLMWLIGLGLMVLLAWQIGYWILNSIQSPSVTTNPVDEVSPNNVSSILIDESSRAVEAANMVNSNYVRPTIAPNGNPFPDKTTYVDGYPQIYSHEGRYVIFADNVKNSSDILAQLYLAQDTHNQAIRTFFIREREQLRLEKLDAGQYIIRYYQLDGGEQMQTDVIHLNNKNREETVYFQRGHAPIAP